MLFKILMYDLPLYKTMKVRAGGGRCLNVFCCSLYKHTQQTKVVKFNLLPKASIKKVNETQHVFLQGRTF